MTGSPSRVRAPGDPQVRAPGRPDAHRTRSLVRIVKSTRVIHHRHAETFRPSLRDGVTAYFALSLATGLSCHHHPCNAARDITCVMRGHCHKLDASVGASGPHDFAVREPAHFVNCATASTASRTQRP